MAQNVEEISKDIAEVESLLAQATRPHVQDILKTQLQKFIGTREECKRLAAVASAQANPLKKQYIEKLTQYAWDQTKTVVKLYIPIDKEEKIDTDNVTCTFNERSVDVQVNGDSDRKYELLIKNLVGKVDAEKSSWLVKNNKDRKNMVVVSVAKATAGDWSHLTGIEKKVDEAKKKQFENDEDMKADPSAALMNMMKKMYESGDDEMKRSIAKAWTESNDKRTDRLADLDL